MAASETKKDNDNGDAKSSQPGIVKELGELGPGAVITEAALARMMDRHPASIKRAVNRGELPPPYRLLGGPVWTAGVTSSGAWNARPVRRGNHENRM